MNSIEQQLDKLVKLQDYVGKNIWYLFTAIQSNMTQFIAALNFPDCNIKVSRYLEHRQKINPNQYQEVLLLLLQEHFLGFALLQDTKIIFRKILNQIVKKEFNPQIEKDINKYDFDIISNKLHQSVILQPLAPWQLLEEFVLDNYIQIDKIHGELRQIIERLLISQFRRRSEFMHEVQEYSDKNAFNSEIEQQFCYLVLQQYNKLSLSQQIRLHTLLNKYIRITLGLQEDLATDNWYLLHGKLTNSLASSIKSTPSTAQGQSLATSQVTQELISQTLQLNPQFSAFFWQIADRIQSPPVIYNIRDFVQTPNCELEKLVKLLDKHSVAVYNIAETELLKRLKQISCTPAPYDDVREVWRVFHEFINSGTRRHGGQNRIMQQQFANGIQGLSVVKAKQWF